MQENEIGQNKIIRAPTNEHVSSPPMDFINAPLAATNEFSFLEDAVMRLSILYALWRGY